MVADNPAAMHRVCAPVVPQTPAHSLIQDLTGQVRPLPEVPNSCQLEPTRQHPGEIDFVNS
jgi:hypothetical protein